MLTSGLAESGSGSAFCFVSVLKGSDSGSCLGVLHLRGLGDLLSECLEAAAGTTGALGAGFTFLEANYHKQPNRTLVFGAKTRDSALLYLFR